MPTFLLPILQVALPVLIPAIVGAAKPLLGKVPSVFHPVLAAVLGVASTFLTGASFGDGALAGLAGVGVREVVDQLKKYVGTPAA